MSALDEAIGHAERHITGSATVIDGDTIDVAGERVRLHGIDAPELDQTFWYRGKRLACGEMALAALEALTAGVKLRCEIIERDRYGRLVSKCKNIRQPKDKLDGPYVPLTKGKILLEIEAAELWFRNVEIKVLDENDPRE